MPLLSTRGAASARGFGFFGAVRDLFSAYFFSAKNTSPYSAVVGHVVSKYTNWYMSRSSGSVFIQRVESGGTVAVARSVGVSGTPAFMDGNNTYVFIAGTDGTYPVLRTLNTSTGAAVDMATYTTTTGTVNGLAYRQDTGASQLLTMGKRFQVASDYYVTFSGDISSLGRIATAIGSSGVTNYAYVTYIDTATNKVGIARTYVLTPPIYTPAISWYTYCSLASTPSLADVDVCAMVMNITSLEVSIFVYKAASGIVITVFNNGGAVLDQQYITTTSALSNISCTCIPTYGGTTGLLAISATDSSDTYSAAALMFFTVDNTTGALGFYSAKKVTQSGTNCYAQSMGFSSTYTHSSATANAAIFAQDYGLIRVPVNPSTTTADGTWSDQFKTNSPITVASATYAISPYSTTWQSSDPLTMSGATYYYGVASTPSSSAVSTMPDHFYAME